MKRLVLAVACLISTSNSFGMFRKPEPKPAPTAWTTYDKAYYFAQANIPNLIATGAVIGSFFGGQYVKNAYAKTGIRFGGIAAGAVGSEAAKRFLNNYEKQQEAKHDKKLPWSVNDFDKYHTHLVISGIGLGAVIVDTARDLAKQKELIAQSEEKIRLTLDQEKGTINNLHSMNLAKQDRIEELSKQLEGVQSYVATQEKVITQQKSTLVAANIRKEKDAEEIAVLKAKIAETTSQKVINAIGAVKKKLKSTKNKSNDPSASATTAALHQELAALNESLKSAQQ